MMHIWDELSIGMINMSLLPLVMVVSSIGLQVVGFFASAPGSRSAQVSRDYSSSSSSSSIDIESLRELSPRGSLRKPLR
jgi:hypothetical protein